MPAGIAEVVPTRDGRAARVELYVNGRRTYMGLETNVSRARREAKLYEAMGYTIVDHTGGPNAAA